MTILTEAVQRAYETRDHGFLAYVLQCRGHDYWPLRSGWSVFLLSRHSSAGLEHYMMDASEVCAAGRLNPSFASRGLARNSRGRCNLPVSSPGVYCRAPKQKALKKLVLLAMVDFFPAKIIHALNLPDP